MPPSRPHLSLVKVKLLLSQCPLDDVPPEVALAPPATTFGDGAALEVAGEGLARALPEDRLVGVVFDTVHAEQVTLASPAVAV